VSFALSQPGAPKPQLTGKPGPSRLVVMSQRRHRARGAGTWKSVGRMARAAAVRRPPRNGLSRWSATDVKSWRQLDSCIADARAAIGRTRGGAAEVAMLGFSMGGAVSCSSPRSAVSTVIALAHVALPPSWTSLRSTAAASPSCTAPRPRPARCSRRRSRALAARLRARAGRGVDAERTVIDGAIHPIALRAPWGRTVPMPRAGRWAELVGRELERFCA
jgi:hypothetical protein